jgi:nicotinamide-nucleotide amidase
MYPQKIIAAVKDLLIGQKRTIAVAESVTAGHVQAALSQAENARQFFQGGLTAYNLGQKVRHLGIEPIHALDCDCVSALVSRQMATGVARLFTADYGISITGYAAKVPEKNILVPFAYYSICRSEVELAAKRIELPDADALRVQLYYTEMVLESLLSVLAREEDR